MNRFKFFVRSLLIGSLVVGAFGIGGCTKRPSEEQLTKLEEARAAAESAEKKLAELRQERRRLESELGDKQTELDRHKEERDDIKQKMGQ